MRPHRTTPSSSAPADESLATAAAAYGPVPEQLQFLVESAAHRDEPPPPARSRTTVVAKPTSRPATPTEPGSPPSHEPFRETIDVPTAARILGVSRASGYRYCRLYLDTDGRQGIPCIEVSGRILVLVRRFYKLIFEGRLAPLTEQDLSPS